MAKFKLTWDKQGRWKKVWRGNIYRVSCSDLPIPVDHHTKEKSYSAALNWWENKQASLLIAEKQSHPMHQEISDTEVRLDYAVRHGLNDEAKKLKRTLDKLQTIDEEDTSWLEKGFPISLEHDAVFQDRLKREKALIKSKSIETVVVEFLKTLEAEMKAGLRSKGDYDNHQMALEHFTKHFGKATDINSISSASWEQFYYSLLSSDFSKAYRKRIFCYSRKVIAWAFEMEILDKPIRNLQNKKHRFGREKGTLYTPSVEEVKAILAVLKGKPKLWVLLSLNCGYTQMDLSDLRIDEVDLKKGTITRKRSKMDKKEESTGKDSGQVLQYKLFPETVQLLKQFLPTDKTYWFTTGRLQQRLVQPAKKGRSDNTIHVWRYVKKHIGKTHTFGQIRRAVGKQLRYGDDRKYHDLAPIFMGHVSDAVIDRNYAGQAEIVPVVLTDYLRKVYLS